MLRINIEHQIANEKSKRTCTEQIGPRSKFSCGPKEQGKNQIKLNEHGEVPPGSVEVHEVHRDIDEAEAEKTQDDPLVDRLQSRDERRNEINEMCHPIHWIKPNESRPVPCTPGDVAGFGVCHRRLH